MLQIIQQRHYNLSELRILHVQITGFFVLIHSLFTSLLDTLLLVSSQRQYNILTCNLLFGLIVHFGILKDANICLFLSFEGRSLESLSVLLTRLPGMLRSSPNLAKFIFSQ